MTISEKRKEITNLIDKLYNHLDPTKKNTKKFHELVDKMSDEQFIKYFTKLVNDPKKHLYVEFEAFVNEPNLELVLEAEKKIVGEEYCHTFDYLVFPHLSEDKSKPYVTKYKIFNGYINMRRVQQIVNHKNHVPTNVEKRDARTGQVTQESKASRVSDVELYGMIVQGVDDVIREMYGPRGGDLVMKDEMALQIAQSGTCNLKEMTNSKFNKVSLNTINTIYTAAGLETDLLTKHGILPRTLADGGQEIETRRKLDRSKT